MGNKTRNKTRKRDEISVLVASIHGVSPRYVQMVRAGERENEAILTTVMDLLEGKNKLVDEVKKLVPFSEKCKKRAKTTLGSIRNDREKGADLPHNSQLSII
jgi:hypothetical protein